VDFLLSMNRGGVYTGIYKDYIIGYNKKKEVENVLHICFTPLKTKTLTTY